LLVGAGGEDSGASNYVNTAKAVIAVGLPLWAIAPVDSNRWHVVTPYP